MNYTIQYNTIYRLLKTGLPIFIGQNQVWEKEEGEKGRREREENQGKEYSRRKRKNEDVGKENNWWKEGRQEGERGEGKRKTEGRENCRKERKRGLGK